MLTLPLPLTLGVNRPLSGKFKPETNQLNIRDIRSKQNRTHCFHGYSQECRDVKCAEFKQCCAELFQCPQKCSKVTCRKAKFHGINLIWSLSELSRCMKYWNCSFLNLSITACVLVSPLFPGASSPITLVELISGPGSE